MEKLSILRRPCLAVLLGSFIVSFIALVAYCRETGFSDEKLFYLLAVLRYSSFIIFICSLFLLITNIVRLFRSPCALSVLGIFLFFCSAVYGAGIFLFNAIIISITGGNG